MRLSAAIMGHPARQTWIDQLAAKLPEASVVLDTRNDLWHTGRRALLDHHRDATHHLIVQDDALICADLIAACEAICRVVRDRPISLYTGTGKVAQHQGVVRPAFQEARRRRSAWVTMYGPIWGVALVIPTKDIPHIVELGDRRRSRIGYDQRIGHYYRKAGLECWYTVPSLVDHRPVQENPSLLKARNGNRRAHWWIGATLSPRKIDWRTDPIEAEEIQMTVRYRRDDGYELAPGEGTELEKMLARDPKWTQVDGEPINPEPPELRGLRRPELEEVALAAGVEDPGSLPNKTTLIEAIRKRRG